MEPEYYLPLLSVRDGLSMLLSEAKLSTCELYSHRSYYSGKSLQQVSLFSPASSKFSLFIRWFSFTYKHAVMFPMLKKEKKPKSFCPHILLQLLSHVSVVCYNKRPWNSLYHQYLAVPLHLLQSGFCLHFFTKVLLLRSLTNPLLWSPMVHSYSSSIFPTSSIGHWWSLSLFHFASRVPHSPGLLPNSLQFLLLSRCQFFLMDL